MDRHLVADLASPCLLFGLLAASRRYYWLRGTTYRREPLSVEQEVCFKALVYLSTLGIVDCALRRLGALLVDWPASASEAAALRGVCVHAPFIAWALLGPIGRPLVSRAASGMSESFQRAWIWVLMERFLFPGSKMVLSEDWLTLPAEVARKWMHNRSFMIPLSPHGVLPVGAIINGLTFATGGLRPETASGKKMEHLPEQPGEGLHQRVFPHMQLHAAVASGCFLLPGAYDVYSKLGSFEVSEPYIRKHLQSGKDVAIMPGGAEESRYAHPEPHLLKINSRRGFIRIALEEHRHLLPMYTFGDDGLLPQPTKCPALIMKIQDLVKEVTGLLVPPLLAGMPRLGPLTTVIGLPVDFSDLWPTTPGDKVDECTIDKAHARYLMSMTRLFDTNKALVSGGHAEATLTFC